jgi:hypothetical protein
MSEESGYLIKCVIIYKWMKNNTLKIDNNTMINILTIINKKEKERFIKFINIISYKKCNHKSNDLPKIHSPIAHI